jgi:hypothetical protein
MKNESQIDATLSALGRVQPPPGLERRVNARLQVPRRGVRTIHFVSAAIAASIAISTFALTPAFRELAVRNRSNASPRLISQPASTAHPAFGAASAVHVPPMPIPVAPIPVGQGRGRTRSSRKALQQGTGRHPRLALAPPATPSKAASLARSQR